MHPDSLNNLSLQLQRCLLISDDNRKISDMIGTVLYVSGSCLNLSLNDYVQVAPRSLVLYDVPRSLVSCESHSERTEEMYIPLRPIPIPDHCGGHNHRHFCVKGLQTGYIGGLFVLFCFRSANLPVKSDRIINLLIAVAVTEDEEEEEEDTSSLTFL